MIEQIYTLYKKHYLVDTDTRKIRPNTIFFALKGTNFNGNKFAKDALKKGALYSIVDEPEYANSKRCILVDNVLETLQALATHHREMLGIPIIGLTGSNGKTTTKELINAVLSQQYTTTATVGNLNNHIGVPLTLLSMTPKTEIGIVEMGANHQKEIAFLSSIAKPDFGYITNFGKAHLEGFGSVKGVIKGKSELYDFLRANKKTAFVNSNDKIQLEKTKDIKRLFFDETIEFIEVNPFVKLHFQGFDIQSKLIGSYNFNNIAIALTIGKHFNIPVAKCKRAIENYIPTNNRSQIIKKANNQLILDAYNANPTSMKVALENMSLVSAKSKTVILGDMFELGKTSLAEHQQIADLASSYGFENIFLVGENFANTTTEQHQFSNFEALKTHLENHPLENQYILIKGSRGMALERCLNLIN